MQDLPDLADLLRTARASLLDDVLGAVPADRRRAVRMAASVLAIAERATASAAASQAAEARRFAALYPTRRGDSLAELNRRLAADIRAGRIDAACDPQGPLYRHLLATTIEKLRENNPRVLHPDERIDSGD